MDFLICHLEHGKGNSFFASKVVNKINVKEKLSSYSANTGPINMATGLIMTSK